MASVSQMTKESSPPNGLCILFVEDSIADFELMVRAIRRDVPEVLAERVDSAESLELVLSQNQWDCVVTDYQIPGFGGDACMKLIRRINPDLPVILVTGAFSEEHAIFAMRGGAKDIVIKGNLSRLGPAVIREAQEYLIRRQQAAQERLVAQSERRLKKLLQITNQPYESWQELGTQLLALAVEELQIPHGLITEFHGDEQIIALVYPESGAFQVGMAMPKSSAYCAIAAKSPDFTLIIENAAEQGFAEHPAFSEFGVPQYIGSSLKLKGSVTGGFCCLSTDARPEPFTAQDKEFIRLLAQVMNMELARNYAERERKQKDDQFKRFMDHSGVLALICDSEGNFIYENHPMKQLREIDQMARPRNAHGVEQAFRCPKSETFAPIREQIKQVHLPDSTTRDFLVKHFPIANEAEGPLTGTVAIDITERQNAARSLKRQLDMLERLQSVQLALTSSTNVRITFEVLLDQLVKSLNFEAAFIFVTMPESARLSLGAMRLREDFPEPEMLAQSVQDVAQTIARDFGSDDDLGITRDAISILEDNLVVLPFVHQGQLLGVLAGIGTDRPAFDSLEKQFLMMVANTCAVAVDSTRLMRRLDRTNQDLLRAYDLTLEGWASLLELRDQETLGHTRRVTDMTVLFAQDLGLDDAEIVQLRRGALLHDIGKFGIPDSILLKEGPLSEEEWAVMRTHPVLAFEVLRSIPFLKDALDIPRFHHEKWDGTGYPEGLTGESIPLGARIFAIIDVWDALSFDRPYRKAWPRDKVRREIARLSGAHFDPYLAQRFLELEAIHYDSTDLKQL